jgi:putative hydrolase of the HAD superfamily
MSLILVFDLDDTLYPERTYVRSGMQAVAKMLSQNFTLDYRKTEMRLLEILEQVGRGKIFDAFLQENGLLTKKTLSKCINAYRHHSPNISLYPNAVDVLSKFRGKKYLVTDGHKIAQQSKIDSLEIENFFEKIYLTNRYGAINVKPSLYCFERILERENADWGNLIYVGDNPAKDFVNLNLVGSMTIRVLTGRHRFDSCPSGYDAKVKIKKLAELKKVLKEFYE